VVNVGFIDLSGDFMHEGEDMIGYAHGQYFAVVAVDNIFSNGHIIDWAENVPNSIKELEYENNWLGETEFKAVECGMYIARLSIDDTEADWELIIDDDKNISGYELVGFLNQFVADLEAQVYS
jgi:hypothetical protein